jgi:hypothetical protein
MVRCIFWSEKYDSIITRTQYDDAFSRAMLFEVFFILGAPAVLKNFVV